ncbi:hypothetical protein SAMCCGM7_pC2106 (plasmid) [Sinorhizobium americanum CCGM7]|nr:hypothetical protein SAMCCGM7_pC2106 [Sinorhizobium americanum CCGM7]
MRDRGCCERLENIHLEAPKFSRWRPSSEAGRMKRRCADNPRKRNPGLCTPTPSLRQYELDQVQRVTALSSSISAPCRDPPGEWMPIVTVIGTASRLFRGG